MTSAGAATSKALPRTLTSLCNLWRGETTVELDVKRSKTQNAIKDTHATRVFILPGAWLLFLSPYRTARICSKSSTSCRPACKRNLHRSTGSVQGEVRRGVLSTSVFRGAQKQQVTRLHSRSFKAKHCKQTNRFCCTAPTVCCPIVTKCHCPSPAA